MSEPCRRIHNLAHSLLRHRFPFDEKAIPGNGIYLLFEKGETGHGGDRIVRAEKRIEKRASKFIQANFSFCVFRIDDHDERLDTETRLISTVAACDECRPSAGWLGQHSPKRKISESGLWLVNKLKGEAYSEYDIEGVSLLICS